MVQQPWTPWRPCHVSEGLSERCFITSHLCPDGRTRSLPRLYRWGRVLQLAFTPMLHAKSFLASQVYRKEFFEDDTLPSDEDRPLVVQFAGQATIPFLQPPLYG